MGAWWSYRPGDFLMFAPRVYWRLFELHNAAWWPLPPLLVLAGLIWCAWVWLRPGGAALRVGAVGLGLAWAFVGWAFMLQRCAPINSAAPVFAGLFFCLAIFLGAVGAVGAAGGLFPTRSRARRSVGGALLGWALLGQPLLAIAFGRTFAQAEVFAMAPDPTAAATLGALLLIAPKTRRAVAWLLTVVWTLALTWCAISAATLWTMASAQAWASVGVALVALAAAWSGRRETVGRGP